MGAIEQSTVSLPGLSLRHNFLWTLAGNVIYAGCQWGMLVAIAKLGTPEMLGQFALGLAVTAPVIMFANLQLRAVQATDANKEYKFGHYLGLRFCTSFLALLVIVGIVCVTNYRLQTTLVILVLGFAKIVESISDVFYGLLQQHERMDRIAVSMIIKGPLSLAALVTAIWLTHSVFYGALGLAMAWVLILVLYDRRSGSLILGSPPPGLGFPTGQQTMASLSPIWETRVLQRLAWLSLPLGLAMMLISLNSNIPRYFIERYLGERELGIFAAMAYLMVAGGTIVGALGQSAGPRLAKYAAAGNRGGFQTLLLKLIAIGSLLGLAGLFLVMVAGRDILTLLYRPEYAERLDVLFWLMMAAGVYYVCSFLGYGMTALRYFKAQIPLTALVSGTLTFLCFWLIPGGGLRGAALAMLIAITVQTVLTMAVVHYGLQQTTNT